MSTNIFTPLTRDQLVTNFTNVVQGDTTIPINMTQGSATLAIARASAVNDIYVQAMAQKVALATRYTTATGADLDNLVNQYVPPFTGRIQATYATSSPVDPTSLQATATNSYLYVGNTNGLLVGQELSLTQGTYGATTTITSVVPTTTLSSPAAQGATQLTVASTNGMFAGGTLTLIDSGFSVTVTITSIVDGTHVDIGALTGQVAHTYAAGAEVQLNNIVGINAPTFTGGATISNFTAGTPVRATTMLQGVYFYRNSPNASTPTVAVGYQIQALVGGIVYEVIADANNPDYNATTQLYTCEANAGKLYVPVQALAAGSASNVIAHSLTSLTSSLPGFDGVDHDYAISNGTDTESDASLLSRFQAFIQSNSSATKAAVKAAINSVQTGLLFSVIENVASDGVTADPGNFCVVASDTNGNLSSSLYSSLYAAIDAARPLSILFALVPPSLTTPTIVMVLQINPTNTNPGAVKTSVQNAIYNSFVGTAPGTTLVFNALIDEAMNITDVQDVLKLTVNGNGYDRTSGSFVVVGTGPGNVSSGPLQLLRPPLSNISVN